MATATNSKRGKRYAGSSPGAGPPPRRRRRWLFTTTVLVGLPALLWFAPTILSVNPILNRVVALATSDFQGTITVGSASLAWLSPVVIRDIDVRDADGKEMAAVPLITSGKTLIALVTSAHDLGDFKIEQPQLNLRLHDKSSNLEEAIAAWLAPTEEPTRPVALALSVTGGSANIDDTTTGRQWQIDELDCEVALAHAEGQTVDVTATGRVTPGEPAGRFSLQLKMTQAQRQAAGAQISPLAGSAGEIAVTSQTLPLELFEPILRRAAAHSELAGVLDVDLKAEWDDKAAPSSHATCNGQITASHVVLVGPGLGEDRLRLDRLHVPCNLTLAGPRLEVHQCDLETDIGQIACAGTIEDINKLGPTWIKALWNVLPYTTGEIKGSLDLAKLSHILPATLRVREGLQIDQGAVHLDLTSGPTNGHWACTGRVESTPIVAIEAGRQVTWDHPLLVTIAGHDTADGPVIEHLNGESDFLKFEGSGTPDLFGLTANFELARLVEELEQFLDLGELRVAGDGWTRLTWKRAADESFEADAELQATNLVLARPGKPTWNDPRLVVTAALKGELAGRNLKHVESATMHVASATDEFTVALLAPVAEPRASATTWPFEAHLRGDLKRWMARAEPWLNLPAGWDVAGDADVVSTVRYAHDAIEVEKCQADFNQLHAWGPAIFIDEPRLRVTGTGKLDMAAGTLRIEDASLTAADVTAVLKDASLDFARATGAQRVQQAELQGNLATLMRWIHDPRQAAPLQVSGLVDCKLHADLTEKSPALEMDMTIDDLAATSAAGQSWRERQVRVNASAAYDQANDAFQLARLEINSDAVQLNAAGRIDRWSKDRLLAINGKADYDLEKLALILQPYLPGDVRATGRESRTFSLGGPLANAVARSGPPSTDRYEWLGPLDGKAAMGWQSVSFFGFDVGAADLQATLGKGTLQIVPARLSVSGGTLAVAPTVRLTPAPALLTLPAGPMADHVKVTPEMCEHWLKYALPPLFRAPKVDGAFSVQLAACNVPLDKPREADITGQMTIHSLDMEPGPLMQEFATLLGRPSAARLAQESKVDFKVVQGRVYHRGLELQFPEFTVRTYGSVGFDHTLAIMAEVTLLGKLLRDMPLQKPISVPIAGTLEKPEIDRDTFVKQTIRDAAGGVFQNELQKGLDRLLSPLQPKQ